MDVFQIVTCVVTGLIFLSVLSFGIYLRISTRRANSRGVGIGSSSSSAVEERIYPRLTRVSESQTDHQRKVNSVIDSEERIDADRDVNPDFSFSQEEAVDDSDEHELLEEWDHETAAEDPELEVSETEIAYENEYEVSSEEIPISDVAGPSEDTQADSENVESNDEESSSDDFEEEKNEPREVIATTSLERKPPQRTLFRSKKRKAKKSAIKVDESNSGDDEDSQFLMLFVLGEHEESLPLQDVSRFLLAKNLVFDQDGLFVYRDRDTEEVAFKVADALYPGTFDKNWIDSYRTEGLTFVLKLDDLSNPATSFEAMLGIANECAERFRCTVTDENRNNMSKQTIAHYRHRVADHLRKSMTMYA